MVLMNRNINKSSFTQTYATVKTPLRQRVGMKVNVLNMKLLNKELV